MNSFWRPSATGATSIGNETRAVKVHCGRVIDAGRLRHSSKSYDSFVNSRNDSFPGLHFQPLALGEVS
jgi:hypothetical protein